MRYILAVCPKFRSFFGDAKLLDLNIMEEESGITYGVKFRSFFWECETSRIKDKGAKESGLTYGVSHGHCTPESPYKVKRFVAQHHDHNWSNFSSRN